MSERWIRYGLLLLLFLGCNTACDDCIMGFRVERPSPKTVWHKDKATIRLHRVITHAFPDATMNYRLILHTPSYVKEIKRGSMQAKDFSWSFVAKQLPSRKIAWLLGRTLCVVDNKGKQTCGTLPQTSCPSSFAPSLHTSPNPSFLEAYQWLALAKNRVKIRISGMIALEQLGHTKMAWKAMRQMRLSNSMNATVRLWWDGLFARITGQTYSIDVLKKTLRMGGHCKRSIVLASCVPEITTLYPKMKHVFGPRKQWEKLYEKLYQKCLQRPVPNRSWTK